MDKDKLKKKAEEALGMKDTSANGKLYMDGKVYSIDDFDMQFNQAIDYKGEPQREVKGGLLTMTFHQVTDPDINFWMFHNNVKKSGRIVFESFSGLSSPVMTVEFIGGRCAQYSKDTIPTLTLTIVVTAEEIEVEGIPHRNNPE